MTSGRNMLFCRLVFKFGCQFSNEGFKHCNLVVLAHVILVSHSIMYLTLSYSPPPSYFYFFHIYVAIYPLHLPFTNAEMLRKKWGLSNFFFLIYQTKLVAFLISYSFKISFYYFFNYVWPVRIGGGKIIIWLDRGLRQDSIAIGLRSLSCIKKFFYQF